ncbi:hypothetical protein [Nocardioides jejuensis]|uniref:SnoaL-like domain-containing protein n=1 Tax=Nocardioides jejuensis TaxID=2502782 RepID=A0A4R1BUX7_9ACTN|nr:hypothetical protein [Nocardioides jejuensis]TCJ21105.1 hypothetical protein EPD65_15805 [Nocardioides jejuensis]
MTRLGALALAAGLLTTAACGSGSDSALGRRPTAYPAAGSNSASAAGPGIESELVTRATTAVEAALSYDHATYAADTAAAEALMTRTFAASWERIAERLRPHSDERHARATARVVDAGVTGATSRAAQVLLLIDRSVHSSEGAQTSGGYAVATLRHGRSGWLLAGLGLTPPRRQVTEQRPVPATVLAAATAVADAYADINSAHPHADIARLLSLTSGAFHRDYERASPELVERVVASRAVQDGVVVSAGLSSLKGAHARVVAVVTTVLRIPGQSPEHRILRLDLDLVRTPTAWLARGIRLVPDAGA